MNPTTPIHPANTTLSPELNLHDEDSVLRKIREISVNDNDPFEKVLRDIIRVSTDALDEHRKRSSNHTGIVNGNILTYLLSLGITEASYVGG